MRRHDLHTGRCDRDVPAGVCLLEYPIIGVGSCHGDHFRVSSRVHWWRVCTRIAGRCDQDQASVVSRRNFSMQQRILRACKAHIDDARPGLETPIHAAGYCERCPTGIVERPDCENARSWGNAEKVTVRDNRAGNCRPMLIWSTRVPDDFELCLYGSLQLRVCCIDPGVDHSYFYPGAGCETVSLLDSELRKDILVLRTNPRMLLTRMIVLPLVNIIWLHGFDAWIAGQR